jgi:hypothetical protein
MSARCTCAVQVAEQQIRNRPDSRVKPFLSRARWLLPTVFLAIIPKCPLCLAAYIMAATGIGMSVATASIVRTTCVYACGVSIFYLFVKWLLGIQLRRRVTKRNGFLCL